MAEPTLVQDFSCKGCNLQIPREQPSAPLLLALHGDSHDGSEMLAAWKDVAREHGAVLFAPTCPKALHCPGGSWWRWLQSSDHDPAWLTQQLAAVRARTPIDPLRIYATGYSGGSSYLGFWAPAHSDELAAVGYVSGGYPYAEACGACKTPVRFVLGAADGMYEPYVKPLVRFYETCGGHELSTRLVPRLGHKGMLAALPAGEAELLWTWFSSHTATCLPAADPGGALDASASPAAPAFGASPSIDTRVGQLPAPARGCSCEIDSGPTAAWPWVLLILTCVRGLRPRTHRLPARRAAPRCPERWFRRGSTRPAG